MKIHKDCKIELCASKDPTREAINQAYLDGDTLVATDGRRLVTLPANRDEADKDGYISPDALKQARKGKGVFPIDASQAGFLTVAAIRMPRQESYTFPNWRQFVPKDEAPVAIGLNAKWLWEMAQAMGVEFVKLGIRGDTNPISVSPCGALIPVPEARGVLMSVRIALSPAQEAHARMLKYVPAVRQALVDALTVIDDPARADGKNIVERVRAILAESEQESPI